MDGARVFRPSDRRITTVSTSRFASQRPRLLCASRVRTLRSMLRSWVGLPADSRRAMVTGRRRP